MRLMEKTVAYSATDAQPTWNIHDTRRANKRLYQFVLTSGTLTGLLEGRISDDATWVTVVADLDAAPSAVIDVYPQMRMRFSAAASFVGYLDLDADGRQATYSADRTDS